MSHRIPGTIQPSSTGEIGLPVCSVSECQSLIKRRGLCYAHYMRAWRYGDPLHVVPSRSADLTGQAFGELTALRREPDGRWLCRCSCGSVTVVRIGDLRRGSTRSCGDRPAHPRKVVVSYAGAHDRIEAVRGKASAQACVDCGQPAHDWSYTHADPDELAEMLGRYLVPYSLDLFQYEPRCITCHRRFDRKAGRVHARSA